MAAMTEDAARDFLAAGTRTGKLAVVRRDGSPHVVPIWFVVDDDGSLVFTTGESTIKGRAIRRDGRVSICVDDEHPPFAFVRVDGTTTVSRDPADLLAYATRIGARYMGAERASEFGTRNAVPSELLVRVVPARVVADDNVTGR